MSNQQEAQEFYEREAKICSLALQLLPNIIQAGQVHANLVVDVAFGTAEIMVDRADRRIQYAAELLTEADEKAKAN